ncbi:MAG: aspartate carbamoyltransferase catalytic subunit [Elusimicrobia bacterium]|nr:aspartate carbamoyltransferase catalytic subunit [Elusimicrobiota bacterium]
MKLKQKDLLGLEYLSKEEIELILQTAKPFKQLFTRTVKKVPTLRGKTVVLLFYEVSTRTRTSFELAAKRLSADTVNINVASSSVVKGESLIDTAKTIEALKADFVIIRHSMSGAAHIIAKTISASIINAGDGMHEHPTQGLLDMFTIMEKKGKIKGLNVAIIGDISHSRVAKSNIWGLNKLGANVFVIGPSTMIPMEVEKMNVEVHHDISKIIHKLDVINILRIQKERQEQHLFPTLEEYSELFGINSGKLSNAKKDLLILHPGPMNRGIEISSSIADSKNSVITEQVTNGVAVRMAVLYLLAGGDGGQGEIINS